MSTRRRLTPLVTFAMIATIALVASCGNDPVSPGGGGGALELNSGTIANGGTYVHTFANAGTYNYRCTIHGGMTGSVVVAGGSPASAAVEIANNSFTPSPAAVAPGGTVTWTNVGTDHTVTSN